MQHADALTLTKSELKEALGCTTWARMYSKFLTPHVIEQVLRLDPTQYKRIREFDVEQTRALRKYFGLIPANTSAGDSTGETV